MSGTILTRPAVDVPVQDLTIVTILHCGRHLSYQTVVQEGDDPTVLAETHMLVRGHNYSDHVARFVVIRGAEVETVEGRR